VTSPTYSAAALPTDVATPVRHRQMLHPQLHAIAIVLLLAGIFAAAWVAGWRAHEMSTPSMGTAAPVGTLIITRPVNATAVRVGELIAFDPPGRPRTTFVHRVTTITNSPAGPVIATKGDINGSGDPWALHQSDLVGSVVVRIPDGGFVLQTLPLLTVGILLILLLSSGIPQSVRGPTRIAATSVLCAILVWYYKPLARLDLISQVIAGTHGQATVIATGVLPLQVRAVGGTKRNVTPGQPGTVHLDHITHGGQFRITSLVHLTGWWWLLLLTWTVPILIALLYRRKDPVPSCLYSHRSLPARQGM
jgi:signal peptidase I